MEKGTVVFGGLMRRQATGTLENESETYNDMA